MRKIEYPIAYFSAGTIEYDNKRPDNYILTRTKVGNIVADWENERWLDTRNLVVINAMKRRIDLAKQKGFKAIECDNVHGHEFGDAELNGVVAPTGFSSTKEDDVRFIKTLAEYAHSCGLLYVMKNGLSMLGDVESYVDFYLIEDAFKWSEVPMTYVDKAWFVEYDCSAKDLKKYKSIAPYVYALSINLDK